MDDTSDEKGQKSKERLLRCARCDQTQDCSPENLMAFMGTGWPKCCGETMGLYIQAKLPAGDLS